MKKLLNYLFYPSIAVAIASLVLVLFDSFEIKGLSVSLMVYGIIGFSVTIIFAFFLTIYCFLFKCKCGFANTGKIVVISIVSLFLLSTILHTVGNKLRIQGSARVEMKARLGHLYLKMVEYVSENNGRLPTAQRWCELISSSREEYPDFWFGSPFSEYACSIAFNSNLSELDLNKIQSNVVLLFSAKGEKNLNGSYELMKSVKQEYAYICLVDGRIIEYRLTDGNIVSLECLNNKPPSYESRGCIDISW